MVLWCGGEGTTPEHHRHMRSPVERAGRFSH
jgi:hypothetical protein